MCCAEYSWEYLEWWGIYSHTDIFVGHLFPICPTRGNIHAAMKLAAVAGL